MEDLMLPADKGRLFSATMTPEMDVRFYITEDSKVLLETDEEDLFETFEEALDALKHQILSGGLPHGDVGPAQTHGESLNGQSLKPSARRFKMKGHSRGI